MFGTKLPTNGSDSLQQRISRDTGSPETGKIRRRRPASFSTAGALAFCLSTQFANYVQAQAGYTSADRLATTTSTSSKKSYTAAWVHARPELQCRLYPAAGPSSAGVTVFTDDDGYARFHAVRAAAGDEVQQLTMDCKDSAGSVSSYPVDLTSNETFAVRPLDLANERGIDRPALQGDPMRYSQSQLFQAGYGLRPDPEKDTEAYSRWLTAVSRPGRILANRRFGTRSPGLKNLSAGSLASFGSAVKPDAVSMRKKLTPEYTMPAPSNVTQASAPWWVGSVLTGKPLYDSTSAIFNVPSGIPGGAGTTVTEISIWNGLGGFGPNSGLIQGGVNLYTTPTIAAYGTWREYCCGDIDTKADGGKFVPSPGDRIYSAQWYCDAGGHVNINGGYGCSYLQNLTSGAVMSCTSANGSPCASVRALPLCSVNPKAPNCMTLGTSAEFIIENQSPQVSASSTAFTDFTPQVTMTGSAFSLSASSYLNISTDPSVFLLTDFTKTTSHIAVSLGSRDETYFSVAGTAVNWNQFEIVPACKATTASGMKSLSRKPNTMEIWWICGDGSVWDAYWFEGQGAWKQTQMARPGSASVNGGLTAVSRKPETMELFWIRPDGGVEDAYWYDGQNSWGQFQISGAGSASPNSGLAAVSRKPETMELFWVRPDGGVQDAYIYEGMAAWAQFQIAGAGSASTKSGLAAVARKPTTMELFWVRPDGGVQDGYWYEGQGAWRQLQISGAVSASANSGITVVSRKPTTMELFWIRPDGGVQDGYWYEGQGPWLQFQISGPGSASPNSGMSAVSRQPNTMELWWVRPDGGVQDGYWYENQGAWKQVQISGPGSASPSAGVTAVSRKSGTMELWWIRPDGGVQDGYVY